MYKQRVVLLNQNLWYKASMVDVFLGREAEHVNCSHLVFRESVRAVKQRAKGI